MYVSAIHTPHTFCMHAQCNMQVLYHAAVRAALELDYWITGLLGCDLNHKLNSILEKSKNIEGQA